jgi:F-type H+-transporting ATPase subunit gamma
MAGTKEIRNKIKSVQNTRKITKAMEMVAASKMRRAQERMRAARPYAEKVKSIAANLSKANPEYRPSYLEVREVKNVGVILITTDKGLCGGLNTNILRTLVNSMKEWNANGVKVQSTAIGTKGYSVFK